MTPPTLQAPGVRGTPGRPTRARRAIALWLVALALGGVAIVRAQYSADLSAFLPASPDPGQRLLIEQLQSGIAARTLLIGIEGGDAPARAAASRRLAQALRTSGRFELVQNGERDDWQAAGRWLFDHRYQLSPSMTPQHFSAAGLREAIEDALSLVGTPAGNALKPVLNQDPTGETARIAESLIPASAPRSDQGVWVSRSAPRAVLLATTRAAGADLDGQAAAIAAARKAFAPDAARGLQLQLSGPGVMGVDSRQRIETEAKQLAIGGSLAMALLLGLAFASLAAVGSAVLPVATGVVAGIAAVALKDGTVHGLTLGFGSTLIGESVDYAIYYLIQARAGAGVPGTGWKHWLQNSWPTVRLGLLTSVCGFAALLFSGFPGLAQLGWFSVAGLVAAALTTRYVLPVLRPDGASGRGLRQTMGRVAGALIARAPRTRPVWLLGALASLVLIVWQGGHLWRGDLQSLSPVSPAAIALDTALRDDLGASDARTLVVVDGQTLDQALERAEAAGTQLDALVRAGRLAGYDSPARLLPSLAAQRARQAAIPDLETLAPALKQATAGGALPASKLGPFLQAVQAARRQPPIDRASLDHGDGRALAPVVDAMLLQRAGGGWSVLLPLQMAATPLPAEALRDALNGLTATQVLDVKASLDGLYDRYLGQALWQSALGALAVLALLGVWLRSAKRLLAVVLPLALAVLLTLGGLAAAGAALGILHLVGLLLVVAVGSNYALFFDQLQHDGRVDDDTLASLLLANLTTVVSFGLIALSDIPSLSAIGRVVAPGALLALLLAAALAPPTLREPRRERPAPSRRPVSPWDTARR